MKILITGAGGQLGTDITLLGSMLSDEVFSFSRTDLDVTDTERVNSVVQRICPDVIIHAGAYTAVDAAESNQDDAFRVNAMGTRNLCVSSQTVGAKMCYVSTDYVFDGKKKTPYSEYDEPHPITVYGKSKYAGEQLVRSLSTQYFIVRTSWLYGQHGNNFVKTMLRLGSERDVVRVVNDQWGSPTYTHDLAQFLLSLIQTRCYGIYHASNAESCTWYEFAKSIFEEAGMSVTVEPCTTEKFVRPAPRPKYSVMDNMAIRINGFQPLRSWQEALHSFISEHCPR